MSHTRRLILIAVIGGTILAGWTGAATARPIADQTVSPAATAAFTVQPRENSSGNHGNVDLVAVLGAGLVVLLVAAGTVGYVHRARSRSGAIA